MKRLKYALVAATAMIAGSAQAATNLISNGSFESGTFDWVYSGGVGDPYPAAVLFYNNSGAYPNGAFGEAIPPNDAPTESPDAVGDRAAYFVSDFANETLSQSRFLQVGKYKIGFSAYAPGNGYGNRFDARFTGDVADVNLASYRISEGPSQTWQTFSGMVDVTVAGIYTTSFNYITDGFPAKDVVIDQVYLFRAGGVPEPGAWALMLMGFGGAGAMIRANRRRFAAVV